MSNLCAAIGCTNNRQGMNGKKTMSFHRFPHPSNKPKLCKVWIERSNNTELFAKLSSSQIYSSRLCNVHFHRSQFTNDLKMRLNKNALPTIFAHKVYDVPTKEEIQALEASNRSERRYSEVQCLTDYIPSPVMYDGIETAAKARPACAVNEIETFDLQNHCGPRPRSLLMSSLTASILDPLANSEPYQIDKPNQDTDPPNKLAVGEVITQTPKETHDNIPIVDTSKCPSSQRRPTKRTFIFRKSDAAAATRPICATNEMKTLDLKNQRRPGSMLMSLLTEPISDPLAITEPVQIDPKKDSYIAVDQSSQRRPTGGTFISHGSNSTAASKVDFKPKEQVYPVHKHIVAAKSPILAAMFDVQTTGSEMVNVIDTDLNDNVLTEMLRYIYTGKPGHVRNMIDLLAAAEKYELHELFTLCEERIHISVNTAANVLVVADRHKAEDLKSRTVSFINSNFAAVVQTPGWDNMIKTQPHLTSFMYQQAMAALTKTTTEQIKQEKEETNDLSEYC